MDANPALARAPDRPTSGWTARTLPALDAGRFVAALLVVLFHYGFTITNFGRPEPFAMAMRGGYSGVDYFFVLSGFIIFFAHRRDLGRPDRIAGFFRKRAVRILPMLWLTLVAWGGLRLALPGATTRGGISVATIIADMLLLPHGGPSVLGITWTLTRELIFYLLFSLCLLDRRLGFAVLVAWQAAVAVVALIRPSLGPWGATLFEVHNLGFGIGLAIAAAGPLLPPRAARVTAVAGAALFALLLAVEWRVGGPLDAEARPLGVTLSPLLYVAAAGVLVLGLASRDDRVPQPESRLVGLLGGSSYLLYLIHGPVGSFAIRLLGRLPLSSELLLVVMSALAVAAALFLHVAVERPILRRLRPRRPAPAA